MNEVTGRIHVPGGVLSPGEFRRIVNALQYFGSEYIHIGNRQDLIFKVNKKYKDEIPKRIGNIQYNYEISESKYSNIVTSFPAKNIYNSTPWLTEDLYLEILTSFVHKHQLKINIVDPFQALVPLFTGDLNFVASYEDNYWYLFIKMDPDKKPELWPVLVDGFEIDELSQAIEEVLLTKRKVSLIALESHVYNLRTWNFKVILKDFTLTPTRFFNHEGFHAIGDKYFLGIYNRDNAFPVNFIENLCILCGQTNIGSINLTSWNSFIVKNIEEKDIPQWEKLLGKFGINTGHSHLELNWQLPELDKKAQKIKNYIFKAFEKRGLRTEGLVFGVSDDAHDQSSSIFLTRKSLFTLFNHDFFTSYGVKYKNNFDPNSWEVIPFAEGLKRRNLPNILAYVSNIYYNSLSKTPDLVKEKTPVKVSLEPTAGKLKEVHQCKDCLTVYDHAYGDSSKGIIAGTQFKELPFDYTCSLCDSPKENFIPVMMEKLVVK